MSPQKASSGMEITSAMMRGMTSHSIGLSPIVRMASTSWFTCMVPIWAVKALPERPATMMAVSSTPELAEHADADGLHGEGLGAELLELLDALVGDDDADQEAQHAHDHQRADPHLVHLAHHGVEAEALGLQAGLDEDHEDLAEEGGRD